VKGALEARQPVISVDTKKKELVGDFKNGGRELRPERSAVPVPVHDFKDPELGKAIPYGMRELPKPPCRFCSPATERSIHVMYARVVRFTDVDPDHLAGRLDEVEAREGPPVDIPAKRVQILHDPDQRTAVVIQLEQRGSERGPLVVTLLGGKQACSGPATGAGIACSSAWCLGAAFRPVGALRVATGA